MIGFKVIDAIGIFSESEFLGFDLKNKINQIEALKKKKKLKERKKCYRNISTIIYVFEKNLPTKNDCYECQ